MNSKRLQECTELVNEILRDIELSDMPLSNIILKCLRLCRLLNDEDGILLFTYESSGYPCTNDGFLTDDAWKIAKIAGRRYWKKNEDKNTEYASTNLIAEIENSIEVLKIRLSSANDPNISVSSSNPNQVVYAPKGNSHERSSIVSNINSYTKTIEQVKGSMYKYILEIYNKLTYGNVMESVFTNSRNKVDAKLIELCPEAIQKFVSVYDNMDSNNPEDWANAVHSCRRIIKDVTDKLYPPTDTPIIIGKKTIELTDDKYINRLIQFIISRSDSNTYSDVVGSNLASIGERIDAINNAVCKGTHTDIKQNEAERYIIYTYLLLGDIVSLM